MNQPRFKPFFFHFDGMRGLQRDTLATLRGDYRRRPRGFTLFAQPNEHPHKMDVQVAQCSSKDSFNKKIGRETALQHPIVTINTRDLPKFLAEQATKCTWGYGSDTQYNYMLRYVI